MKAKITEWNSLRHFGFGRLETGEPVYIGRNQLYGDWPQLPPAPGTEVQILRLEENTHGPAMRAMCVTKAGPII